MAGGALNRLNDRRKKKKRDISVCFHYKKGVERDENKNKTKTGGTLIQTFNEHFYSENCRCNVTGNVM